MNIFFISRWYPNMHDNMLGLFIRKHAAAVQKLHHVHVLYVAADEKLKPGKLKLEENTFQGVTELCIYFGKFPNAFVNSLRYAKYYLKGIRRLEKKYGKPNLIHVHVLSRTAFPALWMKIFNGIPYIITEHWSRYLPFNLRRGAYKGFARRIFTKLAVANASAVTTVSQNLARAMQDLGLHNRYFITPNIADMSDFHPVEVKPEKKIQKIVHISCFDEAAKNIKGIINVVETLSHRRTDFLLEIIGDGKDFEEVKQYASRTGLLDHRIVFTGLLLTGELSEKLRTADGFVMFSNYENFPCTIVESLASSVPVISTDVGGIPEHLTPDFGILVKPADENMLLTAIEQLLDHPEIFDKTGMRKYALDHFSVEVSAKRFDEIYTAVAGNKN